ncbi:MAG: Mrp/NBP35 family ATP-binding protein [Gemmatimonadota bacterium]|jgi:ATP-binding protein involved in chromosome partitioning|nr:Mrp/NBP35 family ATP-binding protein [Gemmatimonadota bacterium]
MDRSPNQLLRRVAAALAGVIAPDGEDVVSTGRVRNLEVDEDGVVRFRFVLQAADPGPLVRQARAVAEGVEGVTKVRIDVKLPAAQGQTGQGSGSVPTNARPNRGTPFGPGNVPAPKPDPSVLPGVRRIIAVSSGKGGVGKSTVAVNLAAGLAASGLRVGLMDADIYGPNVPMMIGDQQRPKVNGEMLVPPVAYGVRLMSLGLLLDEGQAAIMRGPMIAGILKQFVNQVEWGELDYLVVDLPPGTGDAQLSLVQTVRVDGVVMVTTPQDVSTSDVRRAISMFERVETPVLGLVENMSGFTCPCCGTVYDLFGSGGGDKLSADTGLPLLGRVPLEPAVREGGDSGSPIVLSAPESPSGTALRGVVQAVRKTLGDQDA